MTSPEAGWFKQVDLLDISYLVTSHMFRLRTFFFKASVPQCVDRYQEVSVLVHCLKLSLLRCFTYLHDFGLYHPTNLKNMTPDNPDFSRHFFQPLFRDFCFCPSPRAINSFYRSRQKMYLTPAFQCNEEVPRSSFLIFRGNF